MAVNRWNQLNEDMKVWIAQFRPDIKLQTSNTYRSNNTDTYTIDVYGLGVRTGYYASANPKMKDETLWTKAEIRKGVTILISAADGKRYQLLGRGNKSAKFTEIVPKRKLSQASILKNRYRRALITIPRQIQKLEDAVNEHRLELPIVQAESERLYNYLLPFIQKFEDQYGISVKQYPYHQSITHYAGKLRSDEFAEMREKFWAIREMRSRIEDLDARMRHIGRYVRGADWKIQAAKEKQKKLGHGQNPNKKHSWEK